MLTLNFLHHKNGFCTAGDLRPFAFSIHQKLRQRFACNELFLLESLGKNAVDARTSMVGISPFLIINAYSNRVEVLGNEALVRLIADELSVETDVQSGRAIVPLPTQQSVWSVLRDIEAAIRYETNEFGCTPLMFGYFAYETIHYLEKIGNATSKDDEIRIQLKLYETIITLSEQAYQIQTFHPQTPTISPIEELAAEIEEILLNGKPPIGIAPEVPGKKSVQFETTRESYLSKARVALEHIRIGDIYQVQIGQKVEVRSEALPERVYERMRSLNPSPYMYLFETDDTAVVGASPELFVRIEGDAVLMRPIAGTLGKRAGITFDMASRHLRSDEKEVAEHMMLVDLCRNDLHRVSNAESVEVSELLGIEEYSHVWHMVSTSTGTLRSDKDKYDVIMASFPAGTMTGTPKIRAMEIIRANEDSDRGLYAGAIGVLAVGSNRMNTALCIRTAVQKQGSYFLRASAGIVSDSDPQKEYAETLHKMGSVYRAVTGEDFA